MDNEFNDQIDRIMLGIAQQVTARKGAGIEPLLEQLFGFLRRKTDFFTAAQDDKAIENALLKACKLQLELAKIDKANQIKQKEKEAAIKKEKEALKKEKDNIKKDDVSSKAKVEKATTVSGKPSNVEIEVLDEETNTTTTNSTPTFKHVATTTTDGTPVSNSSSDTKNEDTEDEGTGILPNSGNGADFEKYSWTQTLNDVNVHIPIPSGIKSKSIICDFKSNKLTVGIKGQPMVFDGPLFDSVRVADCTWTIEDTTNGNKFLGLYLTKANNMKWWSYIVAGEPEINLKKVAPENSKISDLDAETAQTVEKMMYDQRQKQMGKPTSDEQKKQDMLAAFMKQHPDMDFSNAKIT